MGRSISNPISDRISPAVIVNLKLPPLVWSEHERLFCDQKPIGQRDIPGAISELAKNQMTYRPKMLNEILPNCWLELERHKVAGNRI